MITYYFKAYFIRKNDDTYIVEIPELNDCYTYGKTYDEAYSRATELVKEYFKVNPDNLYDYIRVYEGYEEYDLDEHVKVATIVFDVDEFIRENYTNPIKRKITIPEWVDDLAEREGLSLSELLEEAVVNKVGLSKAGWYSDNKMKPIAEMQ